MKPIKCFTILTLLLASQLNSLSAAQASQDSAIAGLKNEDPKVRIESIYTLGKGFDKSLVKYFIEALKDKDPQVRAAAADTLVYFNTPEAVPSLIEALNDTNPKVRNSGIYAFDRLKDKSSIPALKKVLENKDENLRVNAAVVLGRMGDRSGKNVLETALKSKEYFIRLRACIALRNSGDSSSVPVLKESLKDERLSVRVNVARTLWELGDKSGKEVLMKEGLTQLDYINRWNLAAVLEKVNDVSDIDLVMRALVQEENGDSPFSKKYALKAIGRMKYKPAIPVILSMLHPEIISISNERFADYAFDALAEIGDKSAVPVLEKFLNYGYPKTKMKAVWALFQITGEQKYKDMLFSELKSVTPCNRRESAWMIERLNDKSTLTLLKEALKKENEPYTGAVIKNVLEKISGEKVKWTPPVEVKKTPATVDVASIKDKVPFGKRPPVFIYFQCDDCSTIDGMETLVDMVKEIGEKGGKVGYNFFLAPYASIDPERVRLYTQYLFDRGSQFHNHSFYHNLNGMQLTANDLTTQIEDIFGCDRWLRGNIRGLDRSYNPRAGGGGGWQVNRRGYISDYLHEQRTKLYTTDVFANNTNLFPEDFTWPLSADTRGRWEMNDTRIDFCAPPVGSEEQKNLTSDEADRVSIWQTNDCWGGRLGQFKVDEGVEILKANFDYCYNLPARPPIRIMAQHDWEFDYTDTPKPGHENQAEIIKGFLMDVLVTNKDKYPDTYVVTYHQLADYLRTGDLQKVIFEGNGQTDPEFRKTVDQKEKEIIDSAWALSRSFIKKWSVSGPYESSGKENIDKLKWEQREIPDADMAVDFEYTLNPGTASVAAYGLAIVNSSEKKDIQLRIGSSDGVKVWLNGKIVLDKFERRNIKIDSDILPVTLNKGQNKILVKVVRDTGKRDNWGFCCRVTDLSGQSLKDVTY